MNNRSIALLKTHLAVILFGFTAILGKLISLSAIPLVWYRVIIASLCFLTILKISDIHSSFSKSDLVRFSAIGSLIALHWVSFYGSIKLANASIALVCLACTSFLTSIFEPIINKKEFNLLETSVGLIIVPAMILIISYSPSTYSTGILVGILSAVLASLFTILNKKYAGNHNSAMVSFVELSAAGLFLTPFIIILAVFNPDLTIFPSNLSDISYLIILAILCTTVAFLISLQALKEISAFTSTLIINLEPVYGILLAAFLLDEADSLNREFYIGASIIIIAVFMVPILSKKKIEAK